MAYLVLRPPKPEPEPEPEPEGDTAKPPAFAVQPNPTRDAGLARAADAASEQPIEAVDTAPVAPSGVQRFESRFGNARGFRPALLAAGLSDSECAALEQALDDVLDFRRCQPEHEIVYERDAAGRVVRFAYHDRNVSYVEAIRDGEGYRAERVEKEVERIRRVRGGRVRTSLGDAVLAAGLDRSVVGIFVEVFDGRVNFSTQARSGDVFRIVIEEEHLDGEFLQLGQAQALEYVGQNAGTLRAYWFQARGRRGNWYDDSGREIRGGWLRVPCRYDRISSPYNPRRMHPILRRIVPHNGVDFAASTGTPVWAAADGVVSFAGRKGANGNLVSIRHEGGYISHYAHLHRIQRGIRPGVRVEQRQLIGAVGSTGRSTGPHLHFGLKRGGRLVDPMEILNGPGRRLPAGQLGVFRRRMRELDQTLATVRVRTPPESGAEPAPRDPNPDEALD